MKGIMRDPSDPKTPPVVGAICIVRVSDSEVPLRTAYWCNRVWRNPHTAARIIPEVLAYCPINEAVVVLESWSDPLRADAKLVAQAAEPIRCPECGWKAGEE